MMCFPIYALLKALLVTDCTFDESVLSSDSTCGIGVMYIISTIKSNATTIHEIL